MSLNDKIEEMFRRYIKVQPHEAAADYLRALRREAELEEEVEELKARIRERSER